MADHKKEYFSVYAVAKRLGVGWERVESWINSGKLIAIDLNKNESQSKRQFRISQSNLDAFLATQEVDPPTPQVKRRRAKPVKLKHEFL